MITIDDREAKAHPVTRAEVVSIFGRENVTIKRCPFGDYTFEGGHVLEHLGHKPTIAIECATPSDLCSKANTGRLAYQVSNMIANFDIPILLVEGPLIAGKEGFVKLQGTDRGATDFDRLWSILFGGQMHGLRIEFVMSQMQTAKRLKQNYDWWQKDPETHTYFRKVDMVDASKLIPVGEALDARVRLLMALPGVGEEKARDALTTFGSITDLVISSGGKGKALEAIPGWGRGTASKVAAFLNDPLEEINE